MTDRSHEYVNQLDNILEHTNMIPRVTSAVMASLTWWACSSMTYATIQLRRVFDEEDTAYENLDDESKQARADNLQAQIERLQDLIAWTSSFCQADYLPTGEQVVTRFTDQEPSASVTASADDIQEHANLMGITYSQAQQDYEANAENRRQQMVAMQYLAQKKREELVAMIDNAIQAFPPDHLNIDHQLAQRLGDRIGGKLDQYHATRRQRAASTIQERRKRKIASELHLLKAPCDEANKLSDMADEALESEQNEELDHATA